MLKRITLSFLLSFFTVFIFSQNGTLKGFVKDNDGEGVLSANVIIDISKGLAATCGIDGDYELELPAGEYYVLYKSLSKKDKIIKTVIVADETKIQNVVLEDEAEMINTVVVTASKYAKKLSEETVSIEVLSNDLIESNNITDAEDGISKVPGVTITEGQANIRGGSGWSYGAGSRVMVLYDGLPLISAEGGDAKWTFIPIENTEQIEVIKGAASSIYGSGALNGVINVRTGYAKSVPETKISLYSGLFMSPPSYEGAWWMKEGNQLPFKTGFTLLHKRKFKQNDLVFHGQFEQEKSTLKFHDEGHVRFGIKYRHRFKNIEGLSMGLNTNIYRGWGRNFFLWDGDGEKQRIPMAGTSTRYQSFRWTIDPFVKYIDKKENNFSYKFRYFNTANETEQGQGSIPINYYNELQYNRYFENIKFNIVAGLVGNYSTIRSATGNSEETLTGEFNAYNIAPYIQLEKKLFASRLNLTFGARYEYFNLKSIHFESNNIEFRPS